VTRTTRTSRPAAGAAAEPAVRFTGAARERIVESMPEADRGELALRVEAHRLGTAGFDYALTFVGRDEREPDDEVVDAGAFLVFVDPESAALLHGTTVRFAPSLEGSGFEYDNPNAGWDDPVADAVQHVIDDRINPRVGSHGGLVTLLEVRDGVAYLAMHGGCQGCGKAQVTLRQGVETAIREAVPEVREVVDTTDHEAGTQPFFLPGEGGESPLGGG
jgi:Fe/S biogenesis protein NfuA